jgi:hypothetical protein
MTFGIVQPPGFQSPIFIGRQPLTDQETRVTPYISLRRDAARRLTSTWANCVDNVTLAYS